MRNRRIVSGWHGESSSGAPNYQSEYDTSGKLVKVKSPEGLTEYRYDSAGTLVHMLTCQWENGECSAYTLTEYTCSYSNGRLKKWADKTMSMTFEYNDRGMIVRQISRSDDFGPLLMCEAEYTYY